MNYYDEIKNKLLDEEIYCKIKDYSKERHKVKTYYEIGKILSLVGKEYGKNIIVNYGKMLSIEIGSKYNYRTLYRMRKFYEVFSNEKLTPLVSKLTWSHYLQVLTLKDSNEIIYYINQAVQRRLGKRELSIIIKNKEYDRLSIETKNKLIKQEQLEIKDLVPNPILIKNKDNKEILNEKLLHQLVLENITDFMKELGNGFSFIDSEYKIKIGDRFNYIDILLFNIKFNAYVVVELKVNEFKAKYISQVQKYMNYIDKNVKEIINNNTIGILICKKENKFMIEYCSDDRITIREYELV